MTLQYTVLRSSTVNCRDPTPLSPFRDETSRGREEGVPPLPSQGVSDGDLKKRDEGYEPLTLPIVSRAECGKEKAYSAGFSLPSWARQVRPTSDSSGARTPNEDVRHNRSRLRPRRIGSSLCTSTPD